MVSRRPSTGVTPCTLDCLHLWRQPRASFLRCYRLPQASLPPVSTERGGGHTDASGPLLRRSQSVPLPSAQEEALDEPSKAQAGTQGPPATPGRGAPALQALGEWVRVVLGCPVPPGISAQGRRPSRGAKSLSLACNILALQCSGASGQPEQPLVWLFQGLLREAPQTLAGAVTEPTGTLALRSGLTVPRSGR